MHGSNIPGRLVKVKPRQMLVLNDIVSFLQWPAPAIGAIRLDSDVAPLSYEFAADSRTYTESPNPNAEGTFGQFIRRSTRPMRSAKWSCSTSPIRPISRAATGRTRAR